MANVNNMSLSALIKPTYKIILVLAVEVVEKLD